MGLLTYNGNNKIIKRICELLNVKDVQDGEGHSLVGSDGIAVVTGGGGGSSTLAGLTDVDITGASGGDVLALNGSTSKWEDKTLSDVAISGSYDDLLNKPTIPSDFVHASTGGTFEGDVTIDKADGTTSVVGQSKIILGNSTLQTADENSKGVVRLYARGSKYVDICASDGSAISDNRELNVPDKSGTIAVTSDIPAAQVNSDWNASSGVAEILNKPTIPAATAVKGENEQDYSTGNVNLTAEKIGSVRSRAGVTITTLDALVELLTQSGGGRSFIATCNFSNIGVGVTGWQRVIGVSQNGANNGSYNLGLFCLFMPSDSSTNIKYALIDGKTTGNYSVTATGSIPYSSNLTNGTVTSVATGTGLQGGTITSSGTIETYLSRVKKSCNAFPGANKIIWEEYQSGSSYNLPSNAYYHIISMQGPDTKYGTQLALGMNTFGIYYRNYNNETWGSWTSIANTNTITGVKGSADSSYTTSGQVNLGAANVGALALSGGSLSGNLTVARANSGTSSIDSIVAIGNSTPSGTAGCTRGYLRMYGTNAYGAQLLPPNDNAAMRNYTLPSASGNVTLAHTGSDITGSAASLKSGSLTYCSLGTLTGNASNVTLDTKTTAKWALVQQADGNLVVYQNTTAKWSSGTSSRRFKHNIQDMTEERARKILDIRPVTFDWNDDQPFTTRQYDNAGVIAEEVSQVCPDLVVFEDIEGSSQTERRVEYERFTPYLIKMVQMQQKEIEELKQRVAVLEK